MAPHTDRSSPAGSGLGRAILLSTGGILLAAGTFIPEIRQALWGLFGSTWEGPSNTPWVVLRVSIDDLLDFDGSLSWKSAVYFAAKVVAFAYPVAAGAALIAAALFRRSRAVAAACYFLHALAIWGLATAFLAIAGGILAEPSGDLDQARADARQALLFCGAGALFGILGFLELAVAGWGARRAPSGASPVDAVNLPPAALLLLVQTALFVRLHAHPNWPAAGYLVGAVGALLGVCGIVLGLRARRASARPMSP
jgi:hypothetical protein